MPASSSPPWASPCGGSFPLYLRHIAVVPPLEVVLHRSVWSLCFLLGVLAVLRRFGWLRDLRSQPRPPALCGFSALLLPCNWWNELARIVMEQDERVINPIRLVLRKSRELRNVHRILLWTKHTEVRTPVRQQRIGADQVLWQSPRIRMTRHVIVQRRPRSPSVGILYVRR